MRGVSIFACLLTSCTAFAIELYSPYTNNFFAVPEWLPGSVSANMTPGSDSSFGIVSTTNTYASEWSIDESGTKRNWTLGGIGYDGALPVWNGSSWSSPEEIFDFSSAPITPERYPDCEIETYGGRMIYPSDGDKWAVGAYYYLNNEAYRDGTRVAEDSVCASFIRTVSNEVTSVTNLVNRRLTPVLQSSAIHTLDGWAEREYFTALGSREPYHDLGTTPLETLPSNRVVTSRRITGKTNLWNVCEKLVDTSRCEWTSEMFIEPGEGYPYVEQVYPYWSSKAFDAIYGPQLPEDIYWTSAGLYSLSNKCAVLRGLTNEVVWAGEGTNGWLYTDALFPEDFLFGQTYTYAVPVVPPGHAFGFPDVCSRDFDHVRVNAVTNRTRRLELTTQAAANQAMYELNRTILPRVVYAGVGKVLTFERVRQFESFGRSFEEAGLSEFSSGTGYTASEDIHFIFDKTTNYWNLATNDWPAGAESDAIVITSNDVTIVIREHVSGGKWGIPSEEIIAELNREHYSASVGDHYHFTVGSVWTSGDRVHMQWWSDYLPEVSGTVDYPIYPTNTSVAVSATVYNKYDLKTAGVPAFTNMTLMPCAQAWAPGSHGRVDGCHDICTASIKCDDDGDVDLDMHCHVMSRGYTGNIWNIHTNEWNQHRIRMMNRAYDERGLYWPDPKLYVEFLATAVDRVLSSVVIRRGDYPISWETPESSGFWAYVDSLGVWHYGGGYGGLWIAPTGPNFRLDWDAARHEIVIKPQLDLRCRQRITNVVDWNFNSIRKYQ